MAAALAGSPVVGCTSLRIDYHDLGDTSALAAIEPGVTTRAEVLRRLGPPDEMRRPAPVDRARETSPIRRRIIEAGDVFGRDAYTYASGRHTTRAFGILPMGPALFRITWVRSSEERWRIEFDEADVVRSVSHVDEAADADG